MGSGSSGSDPWFSPVSGCRCSSRAHYRVATPQEARVPPSSLRSHFLHGSEDPRGNEPAPARRCRSPDRGGDRGPVARHPGDREGGGKSPQDYRAGPVLPWSRNHGCQGLSPPGIGPHSRSRTWAGKAPGPPSPFLWRRHTRRKPRSGSTRCGRRCPSTAAARRQRRCPSSGSRCRRRSEPRPGCGSCQPFLRSTGAGRPRT